MTTLIDFLLARIAEDEASATTQQVPIIVGVHEGLPIMGWTRFDAARVIAECEAKRRIVASHPIAKSLTPGTHGFGCEVCGAPGDWGQLGNGYCVTLRALALPYADHPDYQQEWA